MVAYGHLLAVFIVQVHLGAIATVLPDPDNSFLDSLIRFKEQYQNPAMALPDDSGDTPPQVESAPQAPLENVRLPSKPSSATLKNAAKSPLSKKTIMDFQSSVEHRPFRGSKVVHSNYFFVPEQVTKVQSERKVQSGVVLSYVATLNKRSIIKPTAGLKAKFKAESSNASPVEHILIDSSVLVSVVCPHMRHDFISDEAVPGKFTLVNTKIKEFRSTNDERRSQNQALFFPNNFANPFSYSYGSRLVASVAYIGICIMVNLIFNIA